MALDFSQLSGAASDLGAAVSDFTAASGNQAQANSYGEAAKVAGQNEQVVANQTAIQQAQTSRQIYKTVSAQGAAGAGAGLKESGSMQDLMRESGLQGGLQHAQVAAQGLIQEASLEQQKESYLGMQNAANTAKQGSEAGGWLSTLGTVASIAMMFI
jgi:hypothetical protein